MKDTEHYKPFNTTIMKYFPNAFEGLDDFLAMNSLHWSDIKCADFSSYGATLKTNYDYKDSLKFKEALKQIHDTPADCYIWLNNGGWITSESSGDDYDMYEEFWVYNHVRQVPIELQGKQVIKVS